MQKLGKPCKNRAKPCKSWKRSVKSVQSRVKSCKNCKTRAKTVQYACQTVQARAEHCAKPMQKSVPNYAKPCKKPHVKPVQNHAKAVPKCAKTMQKPCKKLCKTSARLVWKLCQTCAKQHQSCAKVVLPGLPPRPPIRWGVPTQNHGVTAAEPGGCRSPCAALVAPTATHRCDELNRPQAHGRPGAGNTLCRGGCLGWKMHPRAPHPVTMVPAGETEAQRVPGSLAGPSSRWGN